MKIILLDKIIVIGMLIFLLAGCGLKGNPVLLNLPNVEKPVVSELAAFAATDYVNLQWNLQDDKKLIKYIGIDRSEAGIEGKECTNCPPAYERIGELMINRQSKTEKEKTNYLYNDAKATKGRTYKYRLMLCDDNNNCSETATVQIKY